MIDSGGGMDGCVRGFFLNVYKPRRMTSTRAVATVKRAGRYSRVGHAGTLDPLAEGVLPIAVGRATRMIPHLHQLSKTYVAVAMCGVVTATDDLEGAIVSSRSAYPSASRIREEISAMSGEISQMPPAFSAVRVGGRRAYDLARRGAPPELPERTVTVHSARMLSVEYWDCDGLTSAGLGRFAGGAGGGGRLVFAFEIVCSTGTYVRSLVRDLGEKLGMGACLAGLLRTRVGPFRVADAAHLWQVTHAIESGYVERIAHPPDEVALAMPGIVLGEERARRFGRGASIPAGGAEGPCRAYDVGGRFLGMGDAQSSGLVMPRLVMDPF